MCTPAAREMAAALDEAADETTMPPPPPVAKTATSDYTIGEFGLAPPPPPTRAALGADVSTTLEALQTLVRVEEGMPPVSAGGLQSQFLQGDDLESVTGNNTRAARRLAVGAVGLAEGRGELRPRRDGLQTI